MKHFTFTAERETDRDAGGLCLFFTGCASGTPHDHDYYEFFLTLSGTLTHLVNDSAQVLPQGSLVFVRPRDIHSFYSENPSEVTYINLTFTEETANLLFNYLSESFPSKTLIDSPMPPTVLLTESQKKKLYAEIDELNLVNWQDKQQLKLRLRVLLANIFTKYFLNIPSQRETQIPEWLTRLSDKMSQPDNFTAGTDKMIELSHKSREHLSRSVKKYYGLSLTEYVNELRINYASNQLLNSNAPVIDICFSCGFQNVSLFYRVFKKKYGKSPLVFRKEHGKLADM